MFEYIKSIVNFASDLLTLIASGIAVYLFFTQRDKIVSAINILLNYSFNLSINELRFKLERLNDYNASDKNHAVIILNILNDIQGHLKGNKILKLHFEDIISQIQIFNDAPKNLSEPKKRSLVSELREGLRGIDVKNYKKIIKQ